MQCPTCNGSGELPDRAQNRMDRARVIVAEVANKHALLVKELTSPSRRHAMIEARREAIQRLRAETDLTLKAIGILLGGRDHATILSALHGGKGKRKAPPA